MAIPLSPVVATLILLSYAVAARSQSVTVPASRTPASRDLAGASPIPFMNGAARVQQFYEVAEVGSATRTIRRIALRWDGPTGGTAARHTIRALTVKVGVTGKGIDQLGSVLDDNLTGPLTAVIDRQRLDYSTDGTKTASPEAFGGSDGKLLLPFKSPVVVKIPAGGCLAVEIVASGNTNTNASAQLDFFIDPANAEQAGLSVPNGKGCPAGPNASGATLETSGVYEPGGVISLHGSGYAANAPVLTLITARLLPAKLAFPRTTPICWLYVAPDTGIAAGLMVASSSGNITAFDSGGTIPLPKVPPMCGVVLYVQNASPTPLWSGNQVGVQSSNYRTVVIGCKKKPNVRAWHASNHLRADAKVASAALYGAFAMRID